MNQNHVAEQHVHRDVPGSAGTAAVDVVNAEARSTVGKLAVRIAPPPPIIERPAAVQNRLLKIARCPRQACACSSRSRSADAHRRRPLRTFRPCSSFAVWNVDAASRYVAGPQTIATSLIALTPQAIDATSMRCGKIIERSRYG